MQVDLTPSGAGHGGAVSSVPSPPRTASRSMVGNPPQTLSPDLRGDMPPSQQDRPAAAGDTRLPEGPSKGSRANPDKQCGRDPLLTTTCANSELPKKGEVPKPGAGEAPRPLSTQQRPCANKVNSEIPLGSDHIKANQSKATKTEAQSVLRLPAGFHCTSLFKAGQPVTFLPAANFSSSLCKITVPPAVGQIAALRDATVSQFHVDTQTQSASANMASQLHTYGYHFSIGRAVSSETKPQPVAVKFKGSSTSGSKISKAGVDHSSSVSLLAPGSFPLKQQGLSSASLVPLSVPSTPAVPAVTTVTLQSRPPSLSEKGLGSTDSTSSAYARLESPSCAREPSTVSPPELRDVPLDLSSKSKRQNAAKDPLRTTKVLERQSTSLPNSSTLKRTQTAGFGSAPPYSVYPDALRNGVPAKQPARLLNHQVLEPSTSWAKLAPQSTMANIAGTYVGVASPILASTLRSKDGKCATFVEDLQSIAKQESISIIDQGEQHVSRDTKGSPVGKETPSAGSRHSNSTCSPVSQVNPCKDLFKSALSSSASLHSLSKGIVSSTSAADRPARQPPSRPHHQRASKQQKVLRGSPSSQSGATCHSLIEGSRPDKKWDQVKCPLSNLQSIVKDKCTDTTRLSQDVGGSLERRPEAESLHGGAKDVPFHQVRAGEFPPFRSVKWRGQQQDRDTAHSGSHRGGTTESEVSQEGNKEATTLPAPPDTTKGGPLLAQEPDRGVAKGVNPSSESLSPCVKLEGITLSVLQGQCGVVADGEKNSIQGKGKERRNKERRMSVKRSNFTAAEPSRNMEKEVKRDVHKKSRKTWAARLKCHQAEPAPHSSQQEREQEEACREGGSPPHNKADNVSSLHPPPRAESPKPVSQSSPKESEEHGPPQLRRGRRRGDRTECADWNPSVPFPPTPAPVFRRPRGRPRSNPLPIQTDQPTASPAPSTEGDSPTVKKRRRRRNRKYQNGEYIVEKEQTVEAEAERDLKSVTTRKTSRAGAEPRLSISVDRVPRRALLTRSTSTRPIEGHADPKILDKPSGKRKFKSKHLCDVEEEEKKLKCKRWSSGKRSAGSEGDSPPSKKPTSPFAVPGGPSSPGAARKGCVRKAGGQESPSGRPIPPEVRRLIVNKNAGETLLQRAARLGYQDVVLYCLEKDGREVNRRDNAGYTALHEACAHGWTHIVQLLLEHGADVNCSAQDGTRPIHDAVASDNIPVVWMLLHHGADPTLATYSGQTVVKLAQSNTMKAYLREYFEDLARIEEDSSPSWNFYSSAVFETEQKACWEFLLSLPEETDDQGAETASQRDCFLFEFSSEPLLPCFKVEVSLSQGCCNWFLLSDVLKRLKMSARIFRARYPQFEVASVPHAELCRQVAESQVTPVPGQFMRDWGEDEEKNGPVELVRCVPDLQGLLGSSVQVLEEDLSDPPKPCGR